MTKTTTGGENIDLSVVITVHAEGILLHKTLRSVERALAPLHKQSVKTELLIHCDNPTATTQEYIRHGHALLKEARIFTNHFGDLGSSRNFSVKQARGRYITFIDADDLMSRDWLRGAYHFLENHPFGEYIAHSQLTVEFGGANSMVIKHGEIDRPTDTLLSVFANRWNSIIMAPRRLLLEEVYSPNSPGYGYEDWHLNCRFILRGIHNVLIPETAIFVRRKDSASEWLRQKNSYSVLPANPLLSFGNIRSLPLAKSGSTNVPIFKPSALTRIKDRLLPLVRRVPGAERYGRRAYARLRKTAETRVRTHIPKWLMEEWRSMHDIEKLLFPSRELLDSLAVYDSLTPEHYRTGEAYKQIVDHTTKNHYDYILFVPWLIQGGADLVTINYANTIQSLAPRKNVLVLATLSHQSPWAERLVGVDFVPFGEITAGMSQDVKFRLLEQIVENSGAQHLHIVNSELGYEFVETHRNYLEASGKKIVATSFSQSVDGSGRVFGYSHTHLPRVYEQLELVTTDNVAVTKMWSAEYGFDPDRLLVHYQPVEIPKLKVPTRPLSNGSLKVLWAARLSPEKQPALITEIGQLLKGLDITIDMYGTTDRGFDTSFLSSLPSNVRYKGAFNGFYNLPLEQYDAYLYTSLFDGMPNAVLEAATARLSIVSSSVGGVPELIANEENGMLIDDLQSAEQYAAALRKLLENQNLLQTYSSRLYDRLLSRHSPAAYRRKIEAFLGLIKY